MSKAQLFEVKIIWITSGLSLLIALFLFGVLINKYYLHSPEQKRVRLNNPSNQLIYDKWHLQIKGLGGQKAYTLFKTETEKKTIKTRHTDAHLFGEALYQIEGANGVSICDTSFGYGCYHSFLAAAIYSEGLEVIPTLSEKCFISSDMAGLACQHGIGHGILSSAGYDLDSLAKSINVCDKLKSKGPVDGCVAGIFMEYNFQTMLVDDGKIRSIDENDPYFPCFNIGKAYTGACIYQQAQWWLSSLKFPSEARIKQIDFLCDRLTDNDLKTQCYKGFGINLLAYVDYDLDAVREICQSLSSSAAEAICRSGVAILLSRIPDLKKESLKLCTDPALNSENQQLCLKHLGQIVISTTKND